MITWTDLRSGDSQAEKFGSVIYHFPVLTSTNDYAIWLSANVRPKQGAIVSTDYQTAGRGQIGRGWHSAPGLNLCLSYMLFPAIQPQDQFRISMTIALAVGDTIAKYVHGEPVSIKWPNDIYAGDLKIAGILIQNSIQGNQITSCVAGIGLNVNETEFPEELPNPTSLKLQTGSTHNLQHIRDLLSENLTNRYSQLCEKPTHLSVDYHDALYRRHESHLFSIIASGITKYGMISHVDAHGRLVMKWDDGTMETFGFREIGYV